MTDLELVKNLIVPIAKKLGGIFAGRIINAITEDSIRLIYNEVKEDGVRAAAEAIVRIGRQPLPGTQDN